MTRAGELRRSAFFGGLLGVCLYLIVIAADPTHAAVWVHLFAATIFVGGGVVAATLLWGIGRAADGMMEHFVPSDDADALAAHRRRVTRFLQHFGEATFLAAMSATLLVYAGLEGDLPALLSGSRSGQPSSAVFAAVIGLAGAVKAFTEAARGLTLRLQADLETGASQSAAESEE